MRSLRTFTASVLAIVATSPAWAAGPAGSGSPADSIAALKAGILAISRENTFDTAAELPETRARLEPLVQRLVSLAGRDDVDTQLAKVEGAWHEVWSDDREPEKPGSVLRRDTIYQVVTGSGYFYNIGTSIVTGPTGGNTYTGFLRGVYTPSTAKNGFEIEFTKAGFVDGFLPRGTNLLDAISSAETDDGFLKKYPFDLKAPRGPIGQKGFLTNVYVDGDLRIARGESYADRVQDLYVLEKTETPVAFE